MAFQHLWRRSEGCLAKHQPLRGKRSRASGFWDGKLQRNPDVDLAPIQAHCWPGTLRFQNHRWLDRISSRWWWSWRHSGRLARRLFPACWRLWLHGLVHNEPEDVQIARGPRAQKRWAWTCYTLWLKEVFPLAGPLRHNFEAAYVALKDLEPHLEKALSVSLKAARATSRAIFWKWANCSVACWAKSLLLSCLFSALNVRLARSSIDFLDCFPHKKILVVWLPWHLSNSTQQRKKPTWPLSCQPWLPFSTGNGSWEDSSRTPACYEDRRGAERVGQSTKGQSLRSMAVVSDHDSIGQLEGWPGQTVCWACLAHTLEDWEMLQSLKLIEQEEEDEEAGMTLSPDARLWQV